MGEKLDKETKLEDSPNKDDSIFDYDEYMYRRIKELYKDSINCSYPEVVIFEDYIDAITHYLVSKISEDNTQSEEFKNLIVLLSKELTSSCIGGKLKTDHLTMTLGYIIEGLIFYGMPRKPAIIATSKWLSCSPSTVRIANEKYRSRPLAKLSFFIQSRTNRMAIKVNEYILSKPNFPFEHPKARSAFINLSEHVKNISTQQIMIESKLKMMST